MHQVIPHQRHLLTRLQREWDRLAVSPAAVAAADGWRVWTAPLHSLDDLLVLSGYGMGERDVIACDRLLRDLVMVARADRLAARVVLQRLLPGISAMSRRNSSVLTGDKLDALDEALATAWTVIRLYPLEQRPRYVVANMLREIEYQAFKRDRRRKAEFVPIDTTDLDLVPADDASRCSATELQELLDEARLAGFDGADVELAERLGAGVTAQQLASDRNVTARTIRNHRAIVVHRLRQLALA
jgi:hypothetical protein